MQKGLDYLLEKYSVKAKAVFENTKANTENLDEVEIYKNNLKVLKLLGLKPSNSGNIMAILMKNIDFETVQNYAELRKLPDLRYHIK